LSQIASGLVSPISPRFGRLLPTLCLTVSTSWPPIRVMRERAEKLKHLLVGHSVVDLDPRRQRTLDLNAL
jgi:hypothetical protein